MSALSIKLIFKWYLFISNNGTFSHLHVYIYYHGLHISKQLYSFQPRTLFLKFLKFDLYVGFVMKYPHILSIGQYLICTFSFKTLYVINIKRIFSAYILLPEILLLSTSIIIELSLSWYNMSLSILYPCHSINNTFHKI